LDFDLSLGICNGPQIADMAIPADPDGGSERQIMAGLDIKPFVKPVGIASHIGVRRSRHF
jgi:hypothetical protein